MALALDGTPVSITNQTGSFTLPALATTNSPDIIIVGVIANGGTVTSVTSSNLTFTQRASIASPHIETWYAVANAALVAESISVGMSAGTTFAGACAFAVSGANTAVIWDSHAGIPGTSSAAADPTISTSQSNDFIFGYMRFANTASPTAGTGWSLITNNNFQLAEYKIVSAPQTSLTVAVGTGSGDENGSIVDAITADAVAPPSGGLIAQIPPGRVGPRKTFPAFRQGISPPPPPPAQYWNVPEAPGRIGPRRIFPRQPWSTPAPLQVSTLSITSTSAEGALTGAGALTGLGCSITASLAELDPQLYALAVSSTAGVGDLEPLAAASLGALAVSVTVGEATLQGDGALAALGLSTTVAEGSLLGAGALTGLGLSETVAPGSLLSTGFLTALGVSATSGEASLLGAGALAALGVSATSAEGVELGAEAFQGLGLSVTTSFAQLSPQLYGIGVSSTAALGQLNLGVQTLAVSSTSAEGQLLGSGLLAALGLSSTEAPGLLTGPGAASAIALSSTTAIAATSAAASMQALGLSATAAPGCNLQPAGGGVTTNIHVLPPGFRMIRSGGTYAD